MKNLSKKAKTLWLVQNLILVVVILASYILSFVFIQNSTAKTAVIIGVGIPVILIVAFLIVYPFLRYKFYSYYYDKNRIVIKKGVIFRSEVVFPIKQIQDLHLYEGPIMMMFSLAGIELSTAGSNFTIVCLDKLEAKKTLLELEEYLNAKLEENVNEKI